ncbi:ATP-dependent Clp protease ATP-binding subunit [bacterium]|nr:ATP-dependent Clp protease ATP-binding subunit [bacterium]
MEMWQRFTSRARRAVLLAHSEATRTHVQLIGTEHLLLGLLRLGEGNAVEALAHLGANVDRLRADLDQQMEVGRGGEVNNELAFTPEAQQVIQLAYAEARTLGDPYIGTEHLLLGLLRLGKGPAYRLLRNYGADLAQVRHIVAEMASQRLASHNGRQGEREPQKKSKTPNLDHYSRDLTSLAREGELDPIVGREKEMERVIQILCRRTKNNPCLIGEAGVGKTAIAEGLAQRIAERDVPDLLNNRRLVALDLASLVAGTKYRGEFEERMKRVMEEIRAAQGQIIVFLDELHTIVGTGAAEGAMDASNILKPALARGEMQCIGATTLDEYRKYVEKTPSLERRFQPVMVNEPTPEESLDILRGILDRYAEFHDVVYDDDALDAAVDLAVRYISDRSLPDKAIDLIDEAGSRVKLRAHKEREASQDYAPSAATDTSLFEGHEDDLLPPRRLRDQAEGERLPGGVWESKQVDLPRVYREDIAEVVSTWTGVPVTALSEEESERLLRMEDALHEFIVSQDDAIQTVCRAVRRARAGIQDAKRPTGSFMFLGPTGVGKTYLARVLAKFLFGDEDAVIRIDMSEYMEKFAVSRLIGAPPGYVGYEESGQLSEQVRRRPYCVVLFDEIEKAHPDVFHILLQIMEDGRLTDSQGRVVNFKNAVIIMTSNVGARMISENRSIGFTTEERERSSSARMRDYERMKIKVTDELKRTFSPEFLNRLDDVVVFHALSEEDIRRIVDLQLHTVQEGLAAKGLTLAVTDGVKDLLVKEGYDPTMGARPLRRAIRRIIEDPLAERVLGMPPGERGEIIADVDAEGEVVFRVVEHAVTSF